MKDEYVRKPRSEVNLDSTPAGRMSIADKRALQAKETVVPVAERTLPEGKIPAGRVPRAEKRKTPKPLTVAYTAPDKTGGGTETAKSGVTVKSDVFHSAVIEKVDHGVMSKTTYVWVFKIGSLLADSTLIQARGINLVAGQALSVRLEKSSFGMQDRVAEVRSWREGEGVAVPTATASTKS